MKQPEELGFAAPVSADTSLDNRGTAKITQPMLIAGMSDPNLDPPSDPPLP